MRKTTGISLILLIFLSLCLITFSLLSLSGAVADERLSQKAADRTTEYYAAVSAANEVLTEIDLIITEASSEPADLSDLAAQISGQISSAEHPALVGTVQYQDRILSFDISVTEEQILHAALMMQLSGTADTVSDPGSAEDPDPGTGAALDPVSAPAQASNPAASAVTYDIIEWSIINTGEWHADRTQNLFRKEDAAFLQN